MLKIIVCPSCGYRLCRAEVGSKVNMKCPKCKEELDFKVDEEYIQVGKLIKTQPTPQQ